jgi:hypothetical protein
MTITPVDSKNDLFFVENIYPQNLLTDLLAIDHLQTPSKTEELQSDYPRKKLILTDFRYNAIVEYVQSLQTIITKHLNTKFLGCDTAFWLDLPGFEMGNHLDNNGDVDGNWVAMQIYLTENTKPMPTVFYNSDGTVRFRPEYRINCGYLMLNNTEHWHAMPYAVPKNEYRLTTYTWFWKNE